MTTHFKNITNSNFNLNIDSYVEGSILLQGDPDYYIQVNNQPINCDPDTTECNFNNYLISQYPYINLKLTSNLDNDKCVRISLKNSIEGDISGAVSLSSDNWWISLGDYSLKSDSIISNVFPTEISNRIGFGDYSPTPISGGFKLNPKYSVAYSVGYNDLYRPLANFNPGGNNPDYSNLKLLEGTLCLSRHIGPNLNIRSGYTYSYFNDESTQEGAVLDKNLVSSYSNAINFIPKDTLKFKLSYLTGKVPDVKEVDDKLNTVLRKGQPFINKISDINLIALSVENRLSDTLLLNGGIGINTKEDTIYSKLMVSKLLFKNTVLDLELAYINGNGLNTKENKKITTLKSKVYINY